MKKEDALKILGISADASVETAKKAYRDLAKKYHPDLIKDGEEKFFKDRMQQINVAFHVVLPQLKSQKRQAEHAKTKSTRKSDAQPVKKSRPPVFNKMKNLFEGFRRLWNEKPGPRTRRNRPNAFKRRQRQEENFKDVLQSLQKADGFPQKKVKFQRSVKSRPENRTTDTYKDYLTLRKRYRAASKKRKTGSRVEAAGPVTPVAPVSPVGED